MDDRKQLPITLLLLPVVALGAMLAVQYFSPPEPAPEAVAAQRAGVPQPDAVPVPSQLEPADARARGARAGRCGDPSGIRTRVTGVRGRRPNH